MMQNTKKHLKWILPVLALAVVLIICVCIFGGSKKIGKDAALQAALADAGLTAGQAADIDIEFERDRNASWYDVSFDSGSLEYEYRVNAYTGEILTSAAD